jgi:hypothetical protein
MCSSQQLDAAVRGNAYDECAAAKLEAVGVWTLMQMETSTRVEKA